MESLIPVFIKKDGTMVSQMPICEIIKDENIFLMDYNYILDLIKKGSNHSYLNLSDEEFKYYILSLPNYAIGLVDKKLIND